MLILILLRERNRIENVVVIKFIGIIEVILIERCLYFLDIGVFLLVI